MRWLFYIILVFFCSLGFANVWALNIRGKVVDFETKQPLGSISIFNVNKNFTTYSSDDGSFTMPADIGDVIKFSSLAHLPYQFILGSHQTNILITIELEQKTVNLQEYIFKEKYTPYQLDSIYKREMFQKDLDYKRSGSALSPVSLLSEAISGKAKKMKKFKSNYNFWEEQTFIDTKYNEAIVLEQTGLKGNDAALFIQAYPMAYDFARSASPIEIKMWIRNNFKEWKTKSIEKGHIMVADSLLQIPAQK